MQVSGQRSCCQQSNLLLIAGPRHQINVVAKCGSGCIIVWRRQNDIAAGHLNRTAEIRVCTQVITKIVIDIIPAVAFGFDKRIGIHPNGIGRRQDDAAAIRTIGTDAVWNGIGSRGTAGGQKHFIAGGQQDASAAAGAGGGAVGMHVTALDDSADAFLRPYAQCG